MEVIKDWPPNIDQIRITFRSVPPTAIFTYGDKIYAPSGGLNLSEPLRAHEAVHCRQQLAVGIDTWWTKYCADEKFRFAQELQAHEAEFQSYCAVERDRNKRAQALGSIARRLSGPLYGKIATFDRCKVLIKAAA